MLYHSSGLRFDCKREFEDLDIGKYLTLHILPKKCFAHFECRASGQIQRR